MDYALRSLDMPHRQDLIGVSDSHDQGSYGLSGPEQVEKLTHAGKHLLCARDGSLKCYATERIGRNGNRG
jgi:hypothetical protein